MVEERQERGGEGGEGVEARGVSAFLEDVAGGLAGAEDDGAAAGEGLLDANGDEGEEGAGGVFEDAFDGGGFEDWEGETAVGDG